jgi:hypothetical protein
MIAAADKAAASQAASKASPKDKAGANANGVTSKKGCSPATLIFARGTYEPFGNMGVIVGPAFARDIKAAGVPVTVQGVPYDADITGIVEAIGGAGPGATKMANLAEQAVQNCPNTKLILSGYSQGAMVVRGAVKKLPQNVRNKISSLVTFGDPSRILNPYPGNLKDKSRVFCKSDDPVCLFKGSGVGSHLSYGTDANTAAKFVAQEFKTGTTGSDDSGDEGSADAGSGDAESGDEKSGKKKSGHKKGWGKKSGN